MEIGGRNFDIEKKCYVVGILNYTPDSFFDGGLYNNLDSAFWRVEQMEKEGAAIVDVGCESTRPGHEVILESEEIERICGLVEGLKKRFSVPISVDCRKAAVAKVCLEEGASLINDVSGLRFSEKMVDVVAKYGVACCLGHCRKLSSVNFFNEFLEDVEATINYAVSNGVSRNKILIDPGIGFFKTTAQSLEIINKLEALKTFKLPIFLGASNKSFIGDALNLEVSERMEGTLAVTAIAVFKGVSFIRVHSVKENLRVVEIVEAIKNIG